MQDKASVKNRAFLVAMHGILLGVSAPATSASMALMAHLSHFTECVARAVMRNSGSSGRSRDTVWSMSASSGFKKPIYHK